MDARACRQYTEDMRKRYGRAGRAERSRLLDEFTAVTGYHRKYAIVLLGRQAVPRRRPPGRPSRMSAEAIAALVKIWRAMDYPWSARLVAMLPSWLPYAQAHFAICDETAQMLLALSARAVDRALKPHRTTLKRRLYGRTKPGTLLKHQSVPFALRGIDSDTGSAFVNFHCYDWCKEHELQFTRGRPYHKNDNAYIEQKNWTHVRKIFGWKRITAPEAIAMMNDLYRNELRLMLNYFQPRVKLVERRRVGSRIKRLYDKPKTPFERLIELGALSAEQVAAMTRRASRRSGKK